MGKKTYLINDFSTTFDLVEGFLQINAEEGRTADLRLVHKEWVEF